MNCPILIEVHTNARLPYANVSWDDPNAMDNSGIVTIEQSSFSGDGFHVGVHTVTYTAMDDDGNTGICGFTIIVSGIQMFMMPLHAALMLT